MKSSLLTTVLLSLTLGTSSCATIMGTAVSPVTGGVDLVVLESDHWYYTPFIFIGGAIGGPFVAFYNGIVFDTSRRPEDGENYKSGFSEIFRPYKMVRKEMSGVSKEE